MPAAARNILIAAVIIGLDGDRLLRGGPWRLGFAIWILGVVICIGTVATDASRERRLMLGGALLAAFGLVWRDSPTLYAINMLSLLCMAAMTVWVGSGRRVADLTIVESARAGLLAAVNSTLGAASVISDTVASGRTSARQKGSAGAIVVGTALAVPPIAVVATLLASSDKVFGDMLSAATKFAMSNGVAHLTVIAMLAWIGLLSLDGIVNSLLGRVGIAPIAWLSGKSIVVIMGLVYGYLPFLILPLFVVLERVPESTLEAGTDLGASPFATFRRITLN